MVLNPTSTKSYKLIQSLRISRGILAKSKDLIDCFGSSDKVEVCKFILEKGQLQVSEKERQVAAEILFRDIAAIVSEKCQFRNKKTFHCEYD